MAEQILKPGIPDSKAKAHNNYIITVGQMVS